LIGLLSGQSKTLELHLHHVRMMIINCAHHKLAILRAYFYGQRPGIRGPQGASVAKPEKTSDCCGDYRG
jgi:hypothetical protein